MITIKINGKEFRDSDITYTVDSSMKSLEVQVSSDTYMVQNQASWTIDPADEGWVELNQGRGGGADHYFENSELIINRNPYYTSRDTEILLQWGTYTIRLTIIQEPSASNRPIWADVYYTAAEDVLEYYITLDNKEIFRGKAYRMPNQSRLSININKICQNYLSNDISELLTSRDDSDTATEAFKTFKLLDSNDRVLSIYNFLYDWSYKAWDGNNKVMSNPINGHYDPAMLRPYTTIWGGVVENYLYDGDYDVEICAKYALYYLNSSGGWDALAIEGNVKQDDTITQYSTDRSFNNTALDYEKHRYISEIVSTYELNTGWLTDSQAANLSFNLIPSNNVYMHNLSTDEIIPVVINDNKVTYKTYKNQGKAMVNYTIKVDLSQNKIRR